MQLKPFTFSPNGSAKTSTENVLGCVYTTIGLAAIDTHKRPRVKRAPYRKLALLKSNLLSIYM